MFKNIWKFTRLIATSWSVCISTHGWYMLFRDIRFRLKQQER